MNYKLQIDRSAKLWNLLANLSSKKELITYKKASEVLDIHHRTIKWPLHFIQEYCKKNYLPPLTILIIDRIGNRGKGFIYTNNLPKLELDVFQYDWSSLSNPFENKKPISNKYIKKYYKNNNTVENVILHTTNIPSLLFEKKQAIKELPDQYITLISNKYNSEIYRDFDIIKEFFITFPNWKKNPIQRIDVVNLFKQKKYYLGFIAAMLWGGINASRPKRIKKDIIDGIEPFETIDLFRLLKINRNKVENIIMKVEEMLISGDVKTCFEYLSGDGKMNGIDYPYFTKLMFFLGEANPKIEKKPLILDKWTTNAYLALLINSNQFQKIKRFFTGSIDIEKKLVRVRNKKSDLYDSYVLDMSQWAQEIEVKPSKLEEYIFGISLKQDSTNYNNRVIFWNIIETAKFDLIMK